MVRKVCSRIAVMYPGEDRRTRRYGYRVLRPGHPYTRALLSAVPVLEEQPYKAEECLLEGEPPSPIDLPTGCSFRARCPLAFDRCRIEEPPLYPRGLGRVAACGSGLKRRAGTEGGLKPGRKAMDADVIVVGAGAGVRARGPAQRGP